MRPLQFLSSIFLVFAEADIFSGLGQVLNDSGIPASQREWGSIIGYAILFMLARIMQYVVNRLAAVRAVVAVPVVVPVPVPSSFTPQPADSASVAA